MHPCYQSSVVTLRCTQKLLRRLNTSPVPAPVPPSTRLGDWYAKLLFTRPTQLVLCASERTLLPVVIQAREINTLVPRFRNALRELLLALGIHEGAVEDEECAMADLAFGKTDNRRVLGSMNDFAWMLEGYLHDPMSLLELSLRLAETPCGPLNMNNPERATTDLFSSRPHD